MFTLQMFYIACAVAGGSVLLIQTLLLVFGIGDAHDAAHDIHPEDVGPGHPDTHEGTAGFNLLSVRAIVAFLTFFGLAGWWAEGRGWESWQAALLGLGSGFAVMVMVAWLLKMQSKLNVEGNVRPELAVGKVAQVYLRIPARRAGQGKITVVLQGRTAEFKALTDGEELATGAQVLVLSSSGPDNFVVAALPAETNQF
jgi:hypothetical protein